MKYRISTSHPSDLSYVPGDGVTICGDDDGLFSDEFSGALAAALRTPDSREHREGTKVVIEVLR